MTNRDAFLGGICVVLLLIVVFVLSGMGLIDPGDKPTLVGIILALPTLGVGAAVLSNKRPATPPDDA